MKKPKKPLNWGKLETGEKFLKLVDKYLKCCTSWRSERLIGSPRQRSRAQDPISTINIHEGGH
jgi:hypothetical protein